MDLTELILPQLAELITTSDPIQQESMTVIGVHSDDRQPIKAGH